MYPKYIQFNFHTFCINLQSYKLKIKKYIINNIFKFYIKYALHWYHSLPGKQVHLFKQTNKQNLINELIKGKIVYCGENNRDNCNF